MAELNEVAAGLAAHLEGSTGKGGAFFIFLRKNLVVSRKVCIFASFKLSGDTKSLPRGGYFCVKTEGKKYGSNRVEVGKPPLKSSLIDLNSA